MAYGRRKKGGQRLMELARKSRKAKESRVGGKRYVTPLPEPKPKRKSPAQARKFGARIPVGSRSPATKTQTRKPHGRVIPKDITPSRSTTKRQPTRTPAQRAAEKKRLLAMQKKVRKESAGTKYGSEYKGPPKLGKKEQDAMARAMEFGSGGGLIKAGVGAGLTALGLKAHKWHKAKKAADLASGKTGGQMACIGSARSGSAASRTSGLGKGKPPKAKPKAKAKPKKKVAAKKKRKPSVMSGILKKATSFFQRKPKSAFTKTPKKKTQRRYPK